MSKLKPLDDAGDNPDQILTGRHRGKLQRSPSPWRNCQPDSNFIKKSRTVVKDPDGKAVAEIMANGPFGRGNGRLIELAPEMLECLRAAASAIGEELAAAGERYSDDHPVMRAHRCTLTAIERLIARIDGAMP